MKIRKLSRSEWMFIIVAIALVVLIAMSWERVSTRIAEVWNMYKP
ncbi:MAG: hypothetical protein U9Q98_09265 [Bacteroidota bacterium]|nr:hypothetical protein [Bacteroidota bacterium]